MQRLLQPRLTGVSSRIAALPNPQLNSVAIAL